MLCAKGVMSQIYLVPGKCPCVMSGKIRRQILLADRRQLRSKKKGETILSPRKRNFYINKRTI